MRGRTFYLLPGLCMGSFRAPGAQRHHAVAGGRNSSSGTSTGSRRFRLAVAGTNEQAGSEGPTIILKGLAKVKVFCFGFTAQCPKCSLTLRIPLQVHCQVFASL